LSKTIGKTATGAVTLTFGLKGISRVMWAMAVVDAIQFVDSKMSHPGQIMPIYTSKNGKINYNSSLDKAYRSWRTRAQMPLKFNELGIAVPK